MERTGGPQPPRRLARLRTWPRLAMAALLLLGLWGCRRPGPTSPPVPSEDVTPALRTLPATWTPAPTATPTLTATPTATPTVTPTPTPRPTPTPPPGGLGVTDALQDGIYCHTGRQALFLLPPTTDLYHASMERVNEEGVCYFRVRILFGASADEGPIRGGVEFDHPDAPRLNPPSRTWYFDNVAFLSFNFRRDGPDKPLVLWVDTIRNNRWVEIQVPDYRGRVEGGVLILDIPCEVVPEGATWMVASTTLDTKKCDLLGVEEDRAVLPLP